VPNSGAQRSSSDLAFLGNTLGNKTSSERLATTAATTGRAAALPPLCGWVPFVYESLVAPGGPATPALRTRKIVENDLVPYVRNLGEANEPAAHSGDRPATGAARHSRRRDRPWSNLKPCADSGARSQPRGPVLRAQPAAPDGSPSGCRHGPPTPQTARPERPCRAATNEADPSEAIGSQYRIRCAGRARQDDSTMMMWRGWSSETHERGAPT
jgi:hypothetical protein